MDAFRVGHLQGRGGRLSFRTTLGRMPLPDRFEVKHTPRKAIILAAGKELGAKPLLLERLGEHTILDLVLEDVLQVVAPEDIYVVVGQQQEAIRKHLGSRY